MEEYLNSLEFYELMQYYNSITHSRNQTFNVGFEAVKTAILNKHNEIVKTI